MAEATFLSSQSFSLAGDRSGEYLPGVRIKADCGGDGIKYGTVTQSAYADGLTTVVMTGDALTPNLGSVLHGNDAPESLCAHAGNHAAGARDAITPESIGAAASGRTVTGAGLATGGGALTADRTITVPAATQAQAEAGSSAAVAMTPLSTTQAMRLALELASLGVVPGARTLPRPTLSLAFEDGFSSDIFTFYRASTAGRINPIGLIEEKAADAPRIGHDPVALTTRGLLIEGQATNLLMYSQALDNAAWGIKSSTLTVTPNTAIAPDGTMTADTLAKTASYDCVGQAVTVSLSQYAGSIFVKAGSLATASFAITENGSSTVLARFTVNLETGAVVNANGQGYSQYVGNGWWRIWASTTFTNSSARMYVYPGTYSSSTAGYIYAWQGDFVAAPFPTSPIPTEASAVTRAADYATTLTSDFAFNPSQGTLYVQGMIPYTSSSVVQYLASIDDGASNNRIILYRRYTDKTIRAGIYTGGTSVASWTGPAVDDGVCFKAAIAYKENDSNLVVNGTEMTADSSCTIPTGLTTLRIGSDYNGAAPASGYIKHIAYFPLRLSDANLQYLTR